MIAQRQGVDVAEGAQRQLADRALADLGEDGVAQLVEALRHDPGSPVGDDQADRHRDDGIARRQGVDRVLVEQRHIDVDELAGEQKSDCQHDPRPQLERIARPQIGSERLERAQLVLEMSLGARRADA